MTVGPRNLRQYAPADVTILCLTNDPITLHGCLLASPDLHSRQRFELIEGARCAGEGINRGLARCATRLALVVHQDVYLPAGSLDRIAESANLLTRRDADWAVAGPIGIDRYWTIQGQIWSSGSGSLVGSPISEPARVESLDEVCLLLRMDVRPQLDEGLPGFHLYGTALVQGLKALGRTAYAVSMPMVHHSRPLSRLGKSYFAAYEYCRLMYKHALPIPTVMGGVWRSSWRLRKLDLWLTMRNHGPERAIRATGDPAAISIRLGYE